MSLPPEAARAPGSRLPADARRFLAAFALLWTFFIGEFLYVHLRWVPEPVARLRHVELEVELRPGEGVARVSALLELEPATEPGGEVNPESLAFVIPAVARQVRASDGSGKTLAGRLRPGGTTYLAGWPSAAGREWSRQRYVEPRLDLTLGAGADWRRLRVEYEIDGSRLAAPATLQPERTLLLGSWIPMPEAAWGTSPKEFTFRLKAMTPPGARTLVSGVPERDGWRSLVPVTEVWLVSASLDEISLGHEGRRARVHTLHPALDGSDPSEPGSELPGRGAPGPLPALAQQIGEDVLDIQEALEAWAGPLSGMEWQVATVESLGTAARGRPPLLLLDSGLFRRPAVRHGSRAERRSWMAREMARAWMMPPPPAPTPKAATVLGGALAAVLAQIALSAPPLHGAGAAHAVDGALVARQRMEWMMRCRALSIESSPLPPLSAAGVPSAGLLSSSKLPAALDTISSQIGERLFLNLSLGAAGGPLLQRLARAGRDPHIAGLLTREWLPDLSLEEAETAREGVRVRLADRGRGGVPLRVAVRLETSEGAERLQWVSLAPGGTVEAFFPGVRAWRRIDVDPGRRIFQVEYANDALPRERNPWGVQQRIWDARRFIGRGEFERAAQEMTRAAEMNPTLGETAYWMGFALVKMGRGAEAIRWLEQARLSPLDSDVVAVETLYLLGQAHEAAGNRERAREFYEQVIQENWTALSVGRARSALERLSAG